MTRHIALALSLVALGGCAKVADLEPKAGTSLPQKPALASRPLTAKELLAVPPRANPDRVDELNKRGDRREPDRFDLPPPDGELLGAPGTPDTTGPDNQEPQAR